jgi:hypothetical protein
MPGVVLTTCADVFILCDDGHGGNTYQIWVNNKADGFSLASEGAMPSGVQTVSFADVGMIVFCPATLDYLYVL